MTPMRESLQAEAVRELGALLCSVCGKPKQKGRSFCGPCYHTLPPEMQRALYKTLSEGYASAFDEARTWLKVEGVG